MMAPGTIRRELRRVLLPFRGVGYLFVQLAEACMLCDGGETSE
jgi:hypothetical protein